MLLERWSLSDPPATECVSTTDFCFCLSCSASLLVSHRIVPAQDSSQPVGDSRVRILLRWLRCALNICQVHLIVRNHQGSWAYRAELIVFADAVGAQREAYHRRVSKPTRHLSVECRSLACPLLGAGFASCREGCRNDLHASLAHLQTQCPRVCDRRVSPLAAIPLSIA